MLRLTNKEWEDFKRHNNPEVFTEQQLGAWVEGCKETLIKAEVDELNDIEKAEVENFKSELQSFIKVEVVGQHSDPLIKGLSYQTFYTRPQQIIWDADEIVKSEDGREEIVKSKGGIYADTTQNRKMGRVGQKFEKSESNNDLEKGGEGSRGGKIIGHTKSGKPIYETGDKVKYFHSGLNKHLTGTVKDYKHSDDGNHTYTIKRDGTTDHHEGIKESDMTFKR